MKKYPYEEVLVLYYCSQFWKNDSIFDESLDDSRLPIVKYTCTNKLYIDTFHYETAISRKMQQQNNVSTIKLMLSHFWKTMTFMNFKSITNFHQK